MTEIKVDCLKETCPVPLIETRKAIKRAKKGDIIVVIGTHTASKKEIPMAAEAMGLKVLEVLDDNEKWQIKIKK